MSYCSINRLQDFVFHDSEWELEHLTENTLTASVRLLNIRKGTAQNQSDSDIEIELAHVTFEGFRVHTFDPGRTWKLDENGNSYTDEPLIIYEGSEARSRLVDAMQQGFTMFHLEVGDHNTADIDACGALPFWAAQFSFGSVIIEWDAYRKKAWYELYRQYRKTLHLSTPAGDRAFEIRINCHDDNIYFKKELIKAPSLTVGITYNGKELWGHGTDYLWMDAFADLQRQLPQDVIMKCCLTCRHGNMCPVGNQPDELFCTKDVSITQKSDLHFFTEDDAERTRRIRQYTDLCDDYVHQSDDHFTYNDYLYHLKK